MKFFHISDLHIGKRVCGFSMLEDQREILAQILDLARGQRPDGIFVAGDLYDKSMPSAEAVELADWFLSSFAEMEIPVWVISGNHDCAERIAYGGRMMEQAGIYMSRVFDGAVQKYTVRKSPNETVQVNAEKDESSGCVPENGKLRDGYELADIYLLPYIKPTQVRRFFPEETIETTQDAAAVILGSLELNKDRTNILLMHQFLAGASVCDSEEISVGGSDQVSAAVVDGFDYVALGHLHGPQKVGRETVRYCGSLLKYSFSEAGHRKSVTVVEIGRPAAGNAAGEKEKCATGNAVGKKEKYAAGNAASEKEKCAAGNAAGEERTHVSVSTIPLLPRRDLREIRGPIDRLLSPEVYRGTNTEDYLHITLTDENPIMDAIGKLREVYPNIMRLDFEYGKEAEVSGEEIVIEEKSPQMLFEEFFFRQNGREMNEAQRTVVENIWNVDVCGKESRKVESDVENDSDSGKNRRGGERT